MTTSESDKQKYYPAPGTWVYVLTHAPGYIGQLVEITPTQVVLKHAAWVADTGRAHEFYADPTRALEVEAFPAGATLAIERTAVNTIVNVQLEKPLQTR